MALQKEVRTTQAFGVPGEFYDTTPRRVTSYALEGKAIIARACTLGGSEGRIKMGGEGTFAGILMSPKQHVRPGTEFVATLELPAETQVEAASGGRVIVTLASAAEPGNAVVYDTTTGELSAVADPANPGAGKKTISGAQVALFTVESGGMAVIEM